jgi:choline dehydrogenase
MAASFDYIVVGAGTSGCVVAARLSRGGSVLLLEAGVSDTDPRNVADMIARPERVLDAILNSDIDPPYVSEPQAALDARPIYLLRGVVRGGCSSVNGMIYVRGNRRDFDLWAHLGNEGWSFADVLPYFKRSEDFAAGPSEYHGAGGPLGVRPLPDPSNASRAFIDAAGCLGFAGSSTSWDFNGARQENAAGLYHTTITPRPGPFPFRRASAAFAFLDTALKSLKVRLQARVTNIVIHRGRAVGVKCVVDGKVEEFRADREVIVSAGALESPKLLMLSGIGPKAQLSALKIPVTVDLPGVGENLQDHLQSLIFHHAKRYAGISTFTAEAGLFTHTRDGSGAVSPDLQYHVLAGMKNWPPELDQAKDPYFLICPVLLKPQSRGFVRLRSAKPEDAPIVQPNYLQFGSDMEVLLRGIELMRGLTGAGELRFLFDASRPPFGIDARSQPSGVPNPARTTAFLELPTTPAGCAEFIRRTANTVWHPVGTCRMGRDSLAVVDPQLRVHGVEGLRVADASIMPVVPSGNTNAACYMIGERCADLVGA